MCQGLAKTHREPGASYERSPVFHISYFNMGLLAGTRLGRGRGDCVEGVVDYDQVLLPPAEELEGRHTCRRRG